MLRFPVALAAACLALLAAHAPARAQGYPSQPIRIMVGFGPGSTADVLARLVGKHMETKLGKPVIIENKPGNGSMTAAELVAKADKDSHLLLMGTVAQTLVPARKRMPFRLDRDMTPVALLAIGPNLLATHPSVGARNVQELLALVKANPGAYTFGTSGVGTASHLAAELFNQRAGVKVVVAHYQGGSNQVLVDLLAGRINLVFNVAATMAPHVDKGSLVALGVAQPKRTKLLPNVPTMAEQGLDGFDAGIWIGLLAPAGTPPEIAMMLAFTSTEAVRTDAVVKNLDAQGLDPIGGTPAEFARFILADIEKWTKVIDAAGLHE